MPADPSLASDFSENPNRFRHDGEFAERHQRGGDSNPPHAKSQAVGASVVSERITAISSSGVSTNSNKSACSDTDFCSPIRTRLAAVYLW